MKFAMAQASQNINPLLAYATERKILTHTGFLLENSDKLNISYILRATVNWTGLLLFYTSMGINLFVHLDNFDKLVDTLYLFLTSTVYVCKMGILATKRADLTQIETILTSDVFNSHTRQQDNRIRTKLLLINRASKIFRFLCVSMVVIYSLFPLFQVTQSPVPGWFPFNVTVYKYEVWAFQSGVLLVSTLNHSAVDVLTCSLILLGSAQFEILNDNLMHVSVSSADDGVCAERIKVCVVHHQELLRYVNLIESMFSFGIFVQFVAASTIICITLFQLTVVAPNTIRYFLFLFVLGAGTMEMTIYCICGQEIINKSQDVLEACYFSEWYGFEPTAKKMLIFIVEKAKIPVVMTVGKLFTLSLPTLLQILKSSYSFYTVLQSIYK